MAKVISRIKGGLGNQLFCYAAARRLAIANNAELVIDDVTGFARDRLYHRTYMLDCFNISARKATTTERLAPFERYRRGVMKWLSRRQPFEQRRYIEQEGLDFDERLLVMKVKGTLYLDGLWQSEGYFKDLEQTIREDLRIVPPTDALNKRIAEEIHNNQSVALHLRWFDAPGNTSIYNASVNYYERAIALTESKIRLPRYFIFSDDPENARTKLTLPKDRVVFVSCNRGDEKAYADLWLMTQCKHFIIANSTFSWWGAWLGGEKEKLVITPNIELDGRTAWGFKGLIPDEWSKL
ncbi:MAG TPA: alpha-1,2-fucosyltransferase [Candidatus Brocadiaceae bacterium]|nr:alpha-1,2-fucosyltransferase [Candidatus Woesearchaeota archaeon]